MPRFSGAWLRPAAVWPHLIGLLRPRFRPFVALRHSAKLLDSPNPKRLSRERIEQIRDAAETPLTIATRLMKPRLVSRPNSLYHFRGRFVVGISLDAVHFPELPFAFLFPVS
jgi:hypothetical protein